MRPYGGVGMESLVDVLTARVAERLREAARGEAEVRPRAEGPRPVQEPMWIRVSARAIVESLIRQALANGLEAADFQFRQERLSGGNTAEVVTRITLDLSFVFKCDNDRKLAEEARTIRSIRASGDLPARFRERFPRVFALKDDEPPYAYLMEYFPAEAGYRGMDELLFGSPQAGRDLELGAERLMTEVLNALLEGYGASVDRRYMPNVHTDYIGRIESRLGEAAERDPGFAPGPVRINGERYSGWGECLEEVKSRASKLQWIAPPFVTVVHGDPNPGNIRVKREAHQVDVKFIDVKEWGRGDYLFDMTKIAHYLAVTGPVEKAGQDPEVRCEASGTEVSLEYALDPPAWVEKAIAVLRHRVAEFAREYGDSGFWELRYELGMASNLLGLPLGRLEQGRRGAALMLYAEGLKWLEKFRRGFAAL